MTFASVRWKFLQISVNLLHFRRAIRFFLREHGVSRNFTEFYSSASVWSVWSVQFSPFICIRLIRVIRGLICSVRILRILRIFLPICLRVFPCVPCSLFYSNTDFHGISRNFIHLHPSNPCDQWAVYSVRILRITRKKNCWQFLIMVDEI